MASGAPTAAGATGPLLPVRAHGGGRFFAKVLREVTHGLEATLAAEDTARLPGWLQSLDPRGKVFWLLALLLATAFSRHPLTLLGLCLFAHGLSTLGRLPPGFFLRRVWIFVPLFSLVVAAPAVLNVVTPGEIVLPLVDFGRPLAWGIFYLPAQVGVSAQGLRTATTLLLRVATSVALAVLLVSTTSWPTLLYALEALRLPRGLVFILGMTYRYIILFLHTADAMFLARESRRVGTLAGAEQRRLVAAAAGALLGKSYQLSNEVYLAMISRGFRGQVRLARLPAWRGRDWLAGVVVAVVGMGALVIDRLLTT